MTTKINLKKKKQPVITAADLYCGAGGSSTGLYRAAAELGVKIELTAVNHWEVAIATHSKNHPEARHFCKAVDSINPLELFETRKLDFVLASPSCVHHSRARGGKPKDEQKRADAWDLLRWTEKLYIKTLIIENVAEFMSWGPLDEKGIPLKSKKGFYFKQFVECLRGTYTVDWRILSCADYGDPTTRERFFLIAKRGKNKKIVFPAPSHASRKVLAKKQSNLFGEGELKSWVPAREIIDWTLTGKNIFGRKKSLSENTMKRIYAGLRKYSGIDIPERAFSSDPAEQKRFDEIYQTSPIKIDTQKFRSFVLPNEGFYRGNQARDLSDPIPTVTSRGGGNLVEPWMLNQKASDRRMRSIDEPFFTQTAHSRHIYIVEPYLTKFYGGHDSANLDEPIPTITANYEHYAVAEPFIKSFHSGRQDGGVNRSHSVDEPVRTLDTSNRFALIEPFLTKFNNNQDAQTLSNPLGTITTKDRFGLGEPFLIRLAGEGEANQIEWKVTPQTINGIVEPFLVKIEDAHGAEIHGLLLWDLGAILIVNFRMLQQKELAAAMSFPPDYYFHGTRDEQVKQIGNAVCVETAKALILAALKN